MTVHQDGATISEEQDTLSPLPLMQLATGFWAFKTVAVAHQFGLFTRLSRIGSTTAHELAEAWGIEERPAEMLLTGSASLGLLQLQNGRYQNTPLSENFLVQGKPYYFGGWLQMLDRRLYPGWGKLAEAVSSNRPTTWNPDTQKSLFEGEDPDMLALFWEAMHSISTFTARVLAEAVDFRTFQQLLDVGGGSGAYDIELCRHYPHLRATVYDLPFVTQIAAAKVAEFGLSDRIETVAGDFFTDEAFPPGNDLILLSMIMHDWAPEHNRAILQKCFSALPSGGAIVISELMVNDEKTGPPAAAMMSLNMLIETEGRNYTPAEYGAWLTDLGFRDIQTVWFDAPGANGVVIGYKP